MRRNDMEMLCTKLCAYQNSLHFSELIGAQFDLNEWLLQILFVE
jgi:hypothetical protein